MNPPCHMIRPNESTDALLQCPSCRSRLSASRPVSFVEERCPVCGTSVSVTIFPRLYRAPLPPDTHANAAEGDATCSFFPSLKAEKVCDECGSFLSSRAAVRWGNRDLCLPCLHRLREIEQAPDYLARARLHDRRALALVTLLAPLSLFTAPLALYLLFRYRKAPRGFVHRGGTVWWVALALAVAWMIVWVVFLTVWVSLIFEDFS